MVLRLTDEIKLEQNAIHHEHQNHEHQNHEHQNHEHQNHGHQNHGHQNHDNQNSEHNFNHDDENYADQNYMDHHNYKHHDELRNLDNNQNCEDYQNITINKRKSECIKIIIILLKNIGLLIINIAYCVSGAFLFQTIEQYGEIKNCHEGAGAEMIAIMKSKEYLVDYITYKITTSPLDTTKDNQTVAFENIKIRLEQFSSTVGSNLGSYVYSGQDCTNQMSRWNFFNALLFAFTIVSTIGNNKKKRKRYNLIYLLKY